jgi:hypothetical protein
MTNTIIDHKFWGTLLGVSMALLGFFLFELVTLNIVVSNFILAIGFYLYGRIDGNG